MPRKTLMIVASLLILAVPAVSFAGDRFNDVPESNIFHDDIGWLADQGVTKGCNPPTNNEFCPGDPVTRQQMAAFMRRFANTLQASSKPLLVGSEGTGAVLPEDTWVELDAMSVTVPAGGGALLLNGTAGFFIQDISTDLGALGLLEVTLDETCSDASRGVAAIWNTLSAGADTATTVGSLPVSQGQHTIRLCAVAFHLDTAESTDAAVPRVSALWAADGQISTLATASSPAIDKSGLSEKVQKLLATARD